MKPNDENTHAAEEAVQAEIFQTQRQAMNVFMTYGPPNAIAPGGLQQMMRQQSAEKSAAWQCACGAENTGKFCTECGAKKPEQPSVWQCACGVKNTGKFCTECGKPRN